ncbi:MAG TPA: hypothetical protein VL068_10875 [Microthrixaceae bacterium]|nr:hypothetical protein [Microthrixaceae bacterium]
MTSSISGFIFGFLASALLWAGLRDMFSRPAFQRRNYRDAPLATSAGLVMIIAVFLAAAILGVVEALGLGRFWPGLPSLQLTALAAGGFGLLGLLDDLAVDEGTSGYRGHVKALLAGRLSAGSLKLLAGPAVALVVAQRTSNGSLGWMVLHGAIIALAANLANLFDRAPGRVTKVSTVAVAMLFIATAVPYIDGYFRQLPQLAGVATILGAAWGLMRSEMAEESMIGDAGANPLGAAVGIAVVLTQGRIVQIVVLLILVALNLLSERVSFSSVIRKVSVLRFVDDLGRREGTG